VNLLKDDKIVKVFHAVNQDLDVLQKAFQIKPKKIFDLQLASRFLNYSSPSYTRLAKDFLFLDLDKKMQFSDWTRRPLTKEQLDYAASDVTHLYRLFPKITEALQEKYLWSCQEMEKLVMKENTASILLEKIGLAFLIDKGDFLTAKGLWYLEKILAWREKKVLEKNLLREKIMPSHLIKKHLGLFLLHGDIKSLGNKSDLVSSLKEEPSDFSQEEALLSVLRRKKDLLLTNNKSYKTLKDLAIRTSQELSLDKSLLATKSDLLNLAAKNSLSDKFKEGWRYDVFGKKLEAFFSSSCI
jgi:ribonuclease D